MENIEFKFSPIDKTQFSDKAMLCFSIPDRYDSQDECYEIRKQVGAFLESIGIKNKIMFMQGGLELSIKEPT